MTAPSIEARPTPHAAPGRLIDHLLRQGARPALLTSDVEISYGDLADRVAAVVARVGTTRRLVLDRTFVNGMTAQATPRTIVDASVRLGLALGPDVVAEGVETWEQAEALLDLGCQFGQGFLWSRPLAPADFADWWAGRALSSSWDLRPTSMS